MPKPTIFMLFLEDMSDRFQGFFEATREDVPAEDLKALQDMQDKLNDMYSTHEAIERRAEMEDKLRS